MTYLRALFAIICICSLALSAATWGREPERSIAIGTVEQGNIDSVLGDSICALINSGSPDHGIKCSAPANSDIAANIEAVRTGKQDLAIVPSNWQYFAYEGKETFKDVAFKELWSVFSAQAQSLTLLARKDSGIAKLDDLKGRRVNIGNPGSAPRELMNVLMEAKGWTPADFSLALELKPADQTAALCDGKADAVVFAATHPNALVEQTAKACEVVTLPVTGAEISRLIEEKPYYTEVMIPGGLYKGTEDDVETFGLRSTIVTSVNADQDLVYDVVKIVFGNFDRLQDFNPAFRLLQERQMAHAGLTAPLHSGAQRYFREEGLH